jgi:hypothetical protein
MVLSSRIASEERHKHMLHNRVFLSHRRQAAVAASLSHLHRPRSWSPLPSLAAPAAGRRGTSFLCFVGRVRACLLWCVIGMVGAASGQINLSQLHSHTGGDLHGGISKLMATGACRYLRSIAWFSRCSSDLARSVSRRVAGVCRYPRQRRGAG